MKSSGSGPTKARLKSKLYEDTLNAYTQDLTDDQLTKEQKFQRLSDKEKRKHVLNGLANDLMSAFGGIAKTVGVIKAVVSEEADRVKKDLKDLKKEIDSHQPAKSSRTNTATNPQRPKLIVKVLPPPPAPQPLISKLTLELIAAEKRLEALKKAAKEIEADCKTAEIPELLKEATALVNNIEYHKQSLTAHRMVAACKDQLIEAVQSAAKIYYDSRPDHAPTDSMPLPFKEFVTWEGSGLVNLSVDQFQNYTLTEIATNIEAIQDSSAVRFLIQEINKENIVKKDYGSVRVKAVCDIKFSEYSAPITFSCGSILHDCKCADEGLKGVITQQAFFEIPNKSSPRLLIKQSDALDKEVNTFRERAKTEIERENSRRAEAKAREDERRKKGEEESKKILKALDENLSSAKKLLEEKDPCIELNTKLDDRKFPDTRNLEHSMSEYKHRLLDIRQRLHDFSDQASKCDAKYDTKVSLNDKINRRSEYQRLLQNKLDSISFVEEKIRKRTYLNTPEGGCETLVRKLNEWLIANVQVWADQVTIGGKAVTVRIDGEDKPIKVPHGIADAIEALQKQGEKSASDVLHEIKTKICKRITDHSQSIWDCFACIFNKKLDDDRNNKSGRKDLTTHAFYKLFLHLNHQHIKPIDLQRFDDLFATAAFAENKRDIQFRPSF